VDSAVATLRGPAPGVDAAGEEVAFALATRPGPRGKVVVKISDS
jgi:hypothetical protein